MTQSLKQVFQHIRAPIDFEEVRLSGKNTDNAAFEDALQSIRRNKLCIKGILESQTAAAACGPSLNVALRKKIDAFASVSVIKSLAGVSTRHANVDFVVVRENCEGEYSGLEHMAVPGVIESLKIITHQRSKQIVKFAFDYAVRHGRRRVTCVHKANIMKMADGLFLRTFDEIAAQYRASGIAADSMIVDNTAMQVSFAQCAACSYFCQLVSRPEQFDVIVTPNLYGNIVTNIGAALIGGPGFVAGYNLGVDVALYEPACRHLGRDVAGCDRANPATLLLSASFMLHHVGLADYGNALAAAVQAVFAENRTFQCEYFSTAAFTKALLNKL